VRLGWSHGDQEIFSIQELIEYFNIEDINRAPAAFNLEKLLWLNQHYMKTSEREEVAQELAWHMNQLKIDTMNGPPLTEIIKIQAERSKTLKEMAEKSRYFYEEPVVSQEMQNYFSDEIMPALKTVINNLQKITEWNKETIHEVLMNVASQYELKLGKLAQPIRVALTGGTVSPPIDMTLVLIERLEKI
jgi:glutamyl-tRNA synthetase